MIGALILTQQNMKCGIFFACINGSLWVSGGNTGNAEMLCWIEVKMLRALQSQTTEQPSVRQAAMRYHLVSFPRHLSPFSYYHFLKILFNNISSVISALDMGKDLYLMHCLHRYFTDQNRPKSSDTGSEKLWWETMLYFKTGKTCLETKNGIYWSLCFWYQDTRYERDLLVMIFFFFKLQIDLDRLGAYVDYIWWRYMWRWL